MHLRLQALFQKKQRKISVFLLLFFIAAAGAVTLQFVFSKPARALPVEVTADAPFTVVEVRKSILTTIKENLVGALKQAGKNALRTFATQVAYNAAIAIAEGNYGDSSFWTESARKTIENSADAALGDFLDTTFTGTLGQATNLDLCNPNLNFMLTYAFNIQQEIKPRQPRCTFSQIKQANTNYFTNPQFLDNIGASFDLREHDIGRFQELERKQEEARAEAKKEAERKRAAVSDFKAEDEKTETIQSPPGLKEDAVKSAINDFPREAQIQETDPAYCADGGLLCSTVQVFSSTLVNRGMKRIFGVLVKHGLTRFTARMFVDAWLQAYLSGGGQTVNRGGGGGTLLGADATFTDLAKPNLAGSGVIDTVARFIDENCPSDPDPDQCIITSEFGEAVRQGLTVRQAMGLEPFSNGGTQALLKPASVFGFKNVQKLQLESEGAQQRSDDASWLSSQQQQPQVSEGLPYSSMVVLRKYRVVPVSWEIAALYIAKYGDKSYTLADLTDAYDDPASPFYGLVDPDWVLKAPATKCVRTGFVDDVYDDSCTPVGQDKNDLSARTVKNNVSGQDLCPAPDGNTGSGGKEYDDVNQDGICDPNTDLKMSCGRKRACVDEQTCIVEDEQGNCLDYGYCIEEENVWRFGATQCQPEYASCTAYTNVLTGQQTNYLRRTLNINDCRGDIALGCRAYCQDGSPNKWNCTYTADAGLKPTTADKPTLLFNSSVNTCPEGSAGCQEYIRTTSGSNLIGNPDFEEFDGQRNDTTTDKFAFCGAGPANNPAADAGKSCNKASDCSSGVCTGWEQLGSTPVFAIDGALSNTALQIRKLNSGSEGIFSTSETGSALSERKFNLSFVAHAPEFLCNGGDRNGLACAQDVECPNGGSCTASNNPASCTGIVEVNASSNVFRETVQYSNAAGSLFSYEFTVPAVANDTKLQTVFMRAASCDVVIDQVKLEEIEVLAQSTPYSPYGVSKDLIYLNGTRKSCDADSVGCMLYAPVNGDDAVPGIIRHSDECTPDNVGCRAFTEVSTRSHPNSGFEGLYQKPQSAYRSGKYCQNTLRYGTSCVANADCDSVSGVGDGVCLPTISIVPQTGQLCSANEVGCEAFTNLDIGNVAEAVQYFTKIRPCRKPDPTLCSSYYVWEGSAVTGFQLREYSLEKDTTTNAPKRPDGAGVNTCDEAAFTSGDDPTCQQFFDKDNNVYYVRFDETISCTNDCHPLRNAFDEQVYMAAPSESRACSPVANGCKEYKGNSGNNQRIILNNSFVLDGSNLGWTGREGNTIPVSSESVTAFSGFGSIFSNGNSEMYSEWIPANALEKNRSYVANFWVKGKTADSQGLVVYLEDRSGDTYFLGDNSLSTPATVVNISQANWLSFTIGPTSLDANQNEDIRLVFSNISSTDGVYVSTIKVKENDSVYLVKKTEKISDSIRTCQGEENCQTYNNDRGKQYNLKSFTKLCKQEFLGCEALINTRNSHQPIPEQGKAYAIEHTRPLDSVRADAQNWVVVPEDTVEYFINNSQYYCLQNERGCQAFGLPKIAQDNKIESYSNVFLVNNPDAYPSQMCQRSQEYCEVYRGGKEATSVEVFKNPMSSTCEFKSAAGNSGKAWYKKGTTEPCPVRQISSYDNSKVPAGQVCVIQGICTNRINGVRSNNCSTQAQCSSGYECRGGGDVTGSCSYRGDPVCALGSACEYWVGECPVDQNLCTEFVDVQDKDTGDETPENAYFYINDPFQINTKDCVTDGVNAKRGCIAFEDTGNTARNINSRMYCSGIVTQAQAASDFYEFLRDHSGEPASDPDPRQPGEVCYANDDCPTDQTCVNLDAASVQAPKSCLACSSDNFSCNTGNDLPCCSKPGICKRSDGTVTQTSCTAVSDCPQDGNTYTCEDALWCDSNIVVKVERDRVCDKWLTCVESSSVTDQFGKTTNICLKRDVCDKWSDGGCASPGSEVLANQTYLADTSLDVQARGTENIARKTGYNFAGLNWGNDQAVEGYYPYSQMYEYGTDSLNIEVPNGHFETKIGGRDKMRPDEWEPTTKSGTPTATLQTIRENFPKKEANKYMRVIAAVPVEAPGVFTTFSNPSVFQTGTEFFVVNFKAKRVTPANAPQDVINIELVSSSDTSVAASNENPIYLTEYWKDYSVKLRNRGGDLSKAPAVYLFIRHAKNVVAGAYFDIDDISIKPVLVVQSRPDINVTTYASTVLEDSSKSGTADPYTYIPSVHPDRATYGTVSNSVIGSELNQDHDDPFAAIGSNEADYLSLGSVRDPNGNGVKDDERECVDTGQCHGWITVDFGAAILVNLDNEDGTEKPDVWIKENGGAPEECYTVELAGSDKRFTLVDAPDDQDCVFDYDSDGDSVPDKHYSRPDAFGGSGRQSKIDISTAADASIANGTKAARYVRVKDVSPNDGDSGPSHTRGTDLQYIQALSTTGQAKYVSRSCRAYPNEKAPVCSYRDRNSGVFQVGWEGYCVERHPTNPEWCLNWWPVDVISGTENPFTQEDTGPTPAPLYYCADTETKPLPKPLTVKRYVCIADDYYAQATCQYHYTDSKGTDISETGEESCFAQGVTGSYDFSKQGQACSTNTDCGASFQLVANECEGVDNDNEPVTVEPYCDKPATVDAEKETKYKCSTYAIVEKPRAAALSLIEKVNGDGDIQGEANRNNPDKWALGVATNPLIDDSRYLDEGQTAECVRISPNNCMNNDPTKECLNFNKLYCDKPIHECLKTLRKYYDQITNVLSFRDNGNSPDACENDSEGDGDDGCYDDFLGGPDCNYLSYDPDNSIWSDEDGDGCGEIDDWSNISDWSGVDDGDGNANNDFKVCGYEFNDYAAAYADRSDEKDNPNNYTSPGLDLQGSSWEKDEDYPLLCTKLVEVVDSNGEGKPYSARVIGGLQLGPDKAKEVSSEDGYTSGNASIDNNDFMWNYTYGGACTPYGSVPHVASPEEIGTCIVDDESVCDDPDCTTTHKEPPSNGCRYDPFTGSCLKSNPDWAGNCVVQHAQVELFHPYSIENRDPLRLCSAQTLGNQHYVCDRTGVDSEAPCRVCNNDSTTPGLNCAVDADCSGGKCIPVSAGRVCTGGGANNGLNCLGDADCCPAGDSNCSSYECTSTGDKETGDNATVAASRRLQQLFATSTGEWKWQGADEGYVLDTDDTNLQVAWSVPQVECGSNGHKDDGNASNGDTSTKAYCGVKPEIGTIQEDGTVVHQLIVNNETSGIINISNSNPSIRVSYQVKIDPEQIPIKSTEIDWGDGTPVKSSYEGTTQSKNYTCPTEFVETAPGQLQPSCSECPGDATVVLDGQIKKCKYTSYPKVRVRDNWDWCNGDGATCEAWESFGGEIIVSP